MNDQRFEDEIRAVFDEAAPPLPPDQLLHAFEQQARSTHRRPRWLAHSTEPPMYYDSHLAVGSPTVRMVSIMAATLMLVLAMAGVAIGVHRLLQDEIVVDASGGGDFTTITEALEAARDGTSILVMPGTYSGWLDITKDVSISGVGDRSEVVIEYDLEGQVQDGDWGYGLRLGGIDAAIRNLEIRGPSDGWAILARGGSLDLENVLVHPGPAALRTSGSGSLRNVEFYGLILDGASDVSVEDSRLLCSVRVAGTSEVSFRQVAFLDSEACPPLPGNYAQADVTTSDDTNFGHLPDRKPEFGGVRIEASSPTITDSTFELPVEILGALVPASTGGPRRDLWVHDDPPRPGAAPVIEGSTFDGLEAAIVVVDAARPTIRANSFTDDTVAVVVGKSNAVIERNTVSGGGTAFALTAVAPVLTDNIVEGVSGPAVSITGAAAPILRDNTLCAAGEVLEIADTATPDIDDSNEICDGSAERLVVDASGGGDFTSIREALSAAEDGSTVVVMPGTYSGYLDVTRDVSISGVGDRSEILIEYDHEGQVGEDWGYGVRLDGVDAAISNLEIRGPSDGTAIVARGGSLDLSGVAVQPGPVGLHTSGSGTLRDVELHRLILDGASDLAVEHSVVWCSAHVAATNGVTFTHTDFKHDPQRCPEQLRGRVPVADGVVWLPQEPTSSGGAIWVEAASPTFTDSTFEMPIEIHRDLADPQAIPFRERLWISDEDISTSGAAPIIEGNRFSGLETAISVFDSARPQIRDNVFADNAAAVAVGIANAVIEGNMVSDGETGFVLTAAKPELTGNSVEAVTGPAVAITGAAAPILRDNTLCSEGEVLEIADTATPDIDDPNEVCE